MFRIVYALLFISLMISGCRKARVEKPVEIPIREDVASFVDPFIGTDAHGHTYPGATVPFGMVQLSPDTRLTGWDGCSGYHYSDSIVYGFSHTHLSGTGCSDYGDLLFMPTTGEIRLDNGADKPGSGYSSRFDKSTEKASAGYYAVTLKDYGIIVELTATQRVGFHKYTFPASGMANILIDLKHRDKVLASSIKIVGDSEIEGFRRSRHWAEDQYIYFVAVFSKPFGSCGVAKDDRVLGNAREASGENIKAWVTFQTEDQEAILVKVGVSAVSIEGARKNLQAEVPAWNFDEVIGQAKKDWNRELNRILVEGLSNGQKRTFYTALYHAFSVPNLFMDVDGHYRGRDLEVHRAEGFDYYTVFSLWDTFRGEHPLFTLLQQKRTADFINTFIKQYEEGGELPIWELAANETFCMIGYHAVPVIADAYMKGIRDYDAEKAFAAMKHSAMKDSPELEAYRKYGFIPAFEESESVSKTLEYAYDDWCIAMMAKELGKEDGYRLFIERAQYYKNLFDPSTGFMRAKSNNTWFSPFDPYEVNFNYTEANAWQYTFFVPQDVSGMIGLVGGDEAFISRLDGLFSAGTQTTGREQSDMTGLIGQYVHGNEPSHHMAYLYSFAGAPWKTQEKARQIMDELYNDKPDGLCGNEDCGQMSAWYVLSALGFYPVTPGSDVYILGSPLVGKATLTLENGKTFVVTATNNSAENRYIQSATLKGRKYTKSYITHQDIMKGGELVLEMGPQPNKSWGSGKNDIPVSRITEHLIVSVPFVAATPGTFVEEATLELSNVDGEAVVRYTLDGTEPTLQSSVYKEPLRITETTVLRAFAMGKGDTRSLSIESKFTKITPGLNIKLLTSYAPQYSAGGDLALVDFVRGGRSFRTGTWQGYHGVNLEAILDLGAIKLITTLNSGFMQDMGAYIFLPTQVTYYGSMDGKAFLELKTVKNDVPPDSSGVFTKDFTARVSDKVRYVKVVAKNMGTCPAWHPGAGDKAWIFCDEIEVK